MVCLELDDVKISSDIVDVGVAMTLCSCVNCPLTFASAFILTYTA